MTAASAAIAICGCGTGPRTPSLAGVPLVGGARVVAEHRACDKGANAYCTLQAVVVDDRFATSTALLARQNAKLLSTGWTGTHADTGDERAAMAPGAKLRLTYATASSDLRAIDLGWIVRGQEIALALSRALFARKSAMSLLLEIGPG